MGRNSRAKKEKRAAKRKGAPPRGRSGSGPTVLTMSLNGGDHVEDDGCPVCVAMREMGVADGEPMTERQFERLMQAFGEVEQAGGVLLGPLAGQN